MPTDEWPNKWMAQNILSTERSVVCVALAPLCRSFWSRDWHWHPWFHRKAGDFTDSHQEHETIRRCGPGAGENERVKECLIHVRYFWNCVFLFMVDRHGNTWARGSRYGRSVFRGSAAGHPQKDDLNWSGGRQYRCRPSQLTGRHHGWLQSQLQHSHSDTIFYTRGQICYSGVALSLIQRHNGDLDVVFKYQLCIRYFR